MNPQQPLGRDEAARLLAWYAEMGVDAGLGEEPWNRFAQAEAQAQKAPLPPERPAAIAPSEPSPAPAVLRPQDELVLDARTAAKSAEGLDELRAVMERWDQISIKRTATNLVFADGNPQARLMLVGDAPGREEDLAGKPFVGAAGQLLDRMLAAIGHDRSTIYVANVVPWRPPGNRTPTPQEVELCLPFIRRQIELADPDVVVALGGSAAASLIGTKEGILKCRGRWCEYDTGKRVIQAFAMLHPGYLMRSPLQKRLAWRDLLAIKEVLDKR